MKSAQLVGLFATLSIAPANAEQPTSPGAKGSGGEHAGDTQLMREVEQLFSRYDLHANDHQERMRAVLLREYNDRLAILDKRYDENIKQAEKQKKSRQLETIALLEKFIDTHPRHPSHTPDAMYRLSALYLDESEQMDLNRDEGTEADYTRSLALWKRIITEFPRYRQIAGTLYLYATYVGSQHYDDEKEERRSLQVYLSLVCANKYRPFDDPVLPVTREEAQRRLESRALVNPYEGCEPVTNATEELVLYAWVRGVGSAHFSTPGEMDEAIAAYTQGTRDETASLYDEALYMLAWSYYRRDLLPEAVRLFDQSVVRYDKVLQNGGKPGLKLRDEAMQYIAVSFTDPWEGELETDPAKALQRATDFYRGREAEPYVREVWVTLGNAFLDLGIGAYDQAIECHMKAISDPWHLHPDNPLVHQEIVNAYETKGDKYMANEARQDLVTRYAPCPEERKGTRASSDQCGRWYEANEKNRRAMENYRGISERMLYVAALSSHEMAIKAQESAEAAPNDNALQEEANQLWDKTIVLYRSFLAQHPQSKEAYTFTYGLAEALFFSGHYVDQLRPDGQVLHEGSVRHYRWVADHRDLSGEFYEDSLFKIVKAYEAEATRLIASGQLADLHVPSGQAVKDPVAPQPIPPVHASLQAAYDEYQRQMTDPEHAPKMAFNAALISMTYLHLDDALQRFSAVMDAHCGKEQAVRAKEGMLAIFQARGDDDGFQRTNRKFIVGNCGDSGAIALAEKQNRSVDFRHAESLADQGQHETAALGFYRYYKKAPIDDPSRPGALYNSAQLYQQAGKSRTAIHLFKEFSALAESGDSKHGVFRDSEYRLEAMHLTALSYARVYDYRSAATTYLELYRLATEPSKYGVKPPPAAVGDTAPRGLEAVKLDALYNAALFLELDRDFPAALANYKRYEQEETDRKRKQEAAWAATRIHRSSQDIWELEKAYEHWRKDYGADPGNERKYVFSFYDLANLHDKRGGRAHQKRAADHRDAAIGAWEGISAERWERLEPAERAAAARLAGEFDLGRVEDQFHRRWTNEKLTVQAKDTNAAQKLIANLERKALDVIDTYENLGKKYTKSGVADYTLAAMVRIGQVYLMYPEKVFAMPIPKQIESLNRKYPDRGVVAIYEEALLKELEKKGFRERAKEAFEGVVRLGEEKKVDNKWVMLAKEELNKEFGTVYPILNQELVEGTEEP